MLGTMWMDGVGYQVDFQTAGSPLPGEVLTVNGLDYEVLTVGWYLNRGLLLASDVGSPTKGREACCLNPGAHAVVRVHGAKARSR